MRGFVAAKDPGRGTLLRIDIDMPQSMEVTWKAQKLVVTKASGRRGSLRNFRLPSAASIPVIELIISLPAGLKMGLYGIPSHSARTAGGKLASLCRTRSSELAFDKLYENQTLLVHLPAGNPQKRLQRAGLGFSAGCTSLGRTVNDDPFPIGKASHIIGDVSRFRALTEETEKREYGGGGVSRP
jgi:hypothetical protein